MANVCAKLLQLCLTLCDPKDCSPPGSSVHEILQARKLGWVASSFSRGSSQPKDQTLGFLLWQVDSLPLAPPGKPSWQTDGETVKTVTDFILGDSKITADGDCSHEIKRRLLLGRKTDMNLSKLQEIVKDREAWHVVVHESQKVGHKGVTEQHQSPNWLPRWLSSKGFACQCRRCRCDPWVGKIPWSRKQQPIPVFLPGKFHGQRSLVGYTAHGFEKSQTQLSTQVRAHAYPNHLSQQILAYVTFDFGEK